MLYTVKELAKALKLSTKTVLKRIHEGKIEAAIFMQRSPNNPMKAGRLEYRISQAEFDRLTMIKKEPPADPCPSCKFYDEDIEGCSQPGLKDVCRHRAYYEGSRDMYEKLTAGAQGV